MKILSNTYYLKILVIPKETNIYSLKKEKEKKKKNYCGVCYKIVFHETTITLDIFSSWVCVNEFFTAYSFAIGTLDNQCYIIREPTTKLIDQNTLDNFKKII